MFSKSLFNRNVNLERSVINPLGVPNSQWLFSQETINTLKAIEEYYTFNLANKTYDKIPTDYNKFLRLYNSIHASYLKASNNSSLKLLFLITQEGLVGSMNAYGLNFSNVELTLQNQLLEQEIEDILSGKNKKPALGANTGQFTIQKTFKLAPLFSYYIMLYGMPAPGVGFDQDKLSMLLKILENNCIDPYK